MRKARASARKRARPASRPLDAQAVVAMTRALFEAWDQHDAETLARVLSPAFVRVTPGGTMTRDELLAWMKRAAQQDASRPARTWGRTQITLGATSAVLVGETRVRHEGHAAASSETVVWSADGAAWKVVVAQRRAGGLDGERERYDTAFRARTAPRMPNRLLVEAVANRKPGAALDLTTGQGRNAIYLAAHGWKVTGIDVSIEGLWIARESARKKKLDLELVAADMHEWDFGNRQWDLVTMIYSGSNPTIARRAQASLKKHGLFVLEYFHVDSKLGKHAGGWQTGQLAALFADGFKISRDDVVQDVADWGGEETTLVRFVARKL